jgi:hypothetical protein
MLDITADPMDFSAISQNVSGIEIIDMRGGDPDDDVTLSANDVLDFSSDSTTGLTWFDGTTNQTIGLVVRGDAGDDLHLPGSPSSLGSAVFAGAYGGATYNIYSVTDGITTSYVAVENTITVD